MLKAVQSGRASPDSRVGLPGKFVECALKWTNRAWGGQPALAGLADRAYLGGYRAWIRGVPWYRLSTVSIYVVECQQHRWIGPSLWVRSGY